ncbi:MAG: adenylate/guanylate cyclase domain-containing protein [Roseicyclus sp.]
MPPDCPAVTCRIGLHYGSVILSRLGAQNHQQVTVSGDTVNLASRLMEVAKSRSARIVATSEFANQLEASAVTGVATPARVEVLGWSGDVSVVLWPRTKTPENGDLS